MKKKDEMKPMAAPKKENMAPHHAAKRNVLQHLSNSMKRHMGEGIKSHMDEPMKKVSVEAPDAASLKKGLDVASQLAPHMDEMSKAAAGIMGHEHEDGEPRDMDDAAYDHEETENEMPEDHASLMAEHSNQDDDNDSEMEKLKKHLSKRA